MPIDFSLDQAVVTIGGLFLLLFIWNFFFRRETNAVIVDQSIRITVNGGYSPEAIALPKGKTSRLIFERTDPNACLEEVIIPYFGVRKHLPLNQQVVVEVLPEESGEFRFACGMNMFQGKILVS